MISRLDPSRDVAQFQHRVRVAETWWSTRKVASLDAMSHSPPPSRRDSEHLVQTLEMPMTAVPIPEPTTAPV